MRAAPRYKSLRTSLPRASSSFTFTAFSKIGPICPTYGAFFCIWAAFKSPCRSPALVTTMVSPVYRFTTLPLFLPGMRCVLARPASKISFTGLSARSFSSTSVISISGSSRRVSKLTCSSPVFLLCGCFSASTFLLYRNRFSSLCSGRLPVR